MLQIARLLVFQSTLPQGERRRIEFPTLPHEKISIHAPTRGATANVRGFDASDVISIHAPTRGATQLTLNADFWIEFQSTLPQGERLCNFILSICFTYFNPRSHKGSDGIMPYLSVFITAFQSTLPQGERQSCALF